MKQDLKHLQTYRWLIWGVLCLAYIIAFFHRLALGTVRTDLINTFHISATTFANLGAAYFYAYLLMQIPTGILVDTLGVRITVTAGMFLAAIGSIMFGFATTILMAFSGRLLVGLGVAVVFVSILKTQAEWFYSREFATISGLTVFVGNMGGILAQTPLVILVVLFSWRVTFILIGVLTLVVALLVFYLVRNSPADLRLPTIAQLEGKNPEPEKTNIKRALIAVCKNPYTWPPFIMFAGIHGAFMAIIGTWGNSYLKEVYQINELAAANYMLYSVLGMTLTSLIMGKISDKLRQRQLPMLVLGSIYLITWVILVFYNHGKPPLALLGPLFFVMGASAATFVLGWASCKEVNNWRYEGISLAVINTGGYLGASLIPVIIGVIIDKYQGVLSVQQLYYRGFTYCLVMVAISFGAIFFIKETNCQNIYHQLALPNVTDKGKLGGGKEDKG